MHRGEALATGSDAAKLGLSGDCLVTDIFHWHGTFGIVVEFASMHLTHALSSGCSVETAL